MNLLAAQHILVQDRADWNKPHLSWIPKTLYRSFFNTRKNH